MGRLDEVHTDGQDANVNIRVHVSNTGLVSAEYGVRLANCYPRVKVGGKHMSIIAPHQSRIFVFSFGKSRLRNSKTKATCTGQ